MQFDDNKEIVENIIDDYNSGLLLTRNCIGFYKDVNTLTKEEKEIAIEYPQKEALRIEKYYRRAPTYRKLNININKSFQYNELKHYISIENVNITFSGTCDSFDLNHFPVRKNVSHFEIVFNHDAACQKIDLSLLTEKFPNLMYVNVVNNFHNLINKINFNLFDWKKCANITFIISIYTTSLKELKQYEELPFKNKYISTIHNKFYRIIIVLTNF